MRLWSAGELLVVDEALAAARAGAPGVLVVEGVPGVGKSTLLDEVAGRAEGFGVRMAEAAEGAAAPYSLLAQWGALISPTVLGGQVQPFVAAQQLRALTDELASSGPVLLLVDDLQWADEESVEAVT